MRRLLALAVTAFAASTSLASAGETWRLPSENCRWCGLYYGAFVGGGFTDPRVDFGGVAPGLDSTEVIYGGYAGVNLGARGPLVWGAEALFGGVGGSPDGRSEPGDTDIDYRWVGLLRSRFGYEVSDRVLLYVTSGLAMSSVRVFEQSSGGLAGKETMFGYTFGGGIEAKLDDAWHARVDYAFVALEGDTLRGLNGFVNQEVDARMHLVHLGLSRQFSTGN